MSYPSCKHGNADPNHECQQCATECVISDLTTECRTLRVELAKARKETEALRNELYGGVHSCSDSCSRPACRFRRERDAALAQLATARQALLKLAPRIRGQLMESHPERIALEAALANLEAKDGSQ